MAALLVSLAAAAAQPTLMEQALAAREARQLEQSIALYKKVLAAKPGEAEAWWYQGLNYYDLDRYGEAGRAFATLVRLDSKHGGAWTLLGLCEFREKRYADSFGHIVKGKALGIPPNSELDRVAQYHYVQLLNKLGQFEAAAGPLSDIAKARPDTPLLVELAGINALRIPVLPLEVPADRGEPVQMAGRATLAVWQRRPADARREADALIAAYPTLANVHYLRGWLYLIDQDERAFDEFERELEISPGHVQARLQIAYEWFKRGEAAKGLARAQEAVKLAPGDFTAHNILGRILLELGRVPEATRELEAAVKLAPASPDAHFHLASAYNRAGRKTEAAAHQKRFVELKARREAVQ